VTRRQAGAGLLAAVVTLAAGCGNNEQRTATPCGAGTSTRRARSS